MSENELIGCKKDSEFYQKIGRHLYNSVFVIDKMGWQQGAQGIVIYCGTKSFLVLWIKAFVLQNKKAKKQLINSYYGGSKEFKKLMRLMIE